MTDHLPEDADRTDSSWAAHPAHGTFPPPPPAFPAPPPAFPLHARGRRRRLTGPAVAATLAVGTLAASIVAGHELWPVRTGPAASSATGLPASGGSSGAGGPSAGGPSTGGPSTGGPSTGGPSTGGPSAGGNGASSGSGSSASSTQGAGAPSDVSSIAARVYPAVVDIWTALGYQGAEGAGTGIVLTSSGEILTNNHVIDGATSIKVTDIGNGRTYTANVVGYDSSRDVAVLQLVGASGLRTASIGDASKVRIGEAVVAIGNAGGAGGTPAAAGGSVTALDQSITASDQLTGTSEALSGLTETNADIQSGDSGGPLVDTAGHVIGMDSAAASGFSLQSAQTASSQGYAIPIDQATSIAGQIESGQASSSVHVGSTAFLGVLIASGGASSYGSPWSGPGNPFSSGSSSGSGSSSAAAGAVVSQVVSGGAASQAGLTAGDTITALGGQTVNSADSLSKIIAGDHAGQQLSITWTDSNGGVHDATVTLQAGPPA